MSEYQLEFDFGPEDAIQKFLGIIKIKFGIELVDGNLPKIFWIRKTWYDRIYVAMRTYSCQEVERDFIMELTPGQARALKESGYANFRN